MENKDHDRDIINSSETDDSVVRLVGIEPTSIVDGKKPLLPANEALPPHIPLLPINHGYVFPGMILPVILNQDHHKETVSYIVESKETEPVPPFIGLVLTKAGENPKDLNFTEDTLFTHGVVGRIIKKINLPDGNISILVNCLKRFKINKVLSPKGRIIASVKYLDDIYFYDVETEAIARTVVNQFKQISQDNPLVNEEMRLALANIDGPGKLSDLIASILIRDVATYKDLISTLDVRKRLELLLVLLKKELDVYNFQSKLQQEINQNVSKAQREFFLNEQLKLIQKELGVGGDKKSISKQKFEERAAKLKFSTEAEKKYKDELQKLSMLDENSPEFGIIYNYLDWMTSLPWGTGAEENLSLERARRVLNSDHAGIDDVKQRILEFIAVRKLKQSAKGSIICLVGPPGVGKTSLGKSIAKSLNRPFYRFSVGGMRDEAEIKGHRRTYIGAMPGKIIQGLKKANANNPVFMIDEIDKLGSDFRGDPASALLEALDPEQNAEFMDHYMDVSFDISNVLFICTANMLDTIPGPLLDRMEVIRLAGYILDEKLEIARKHLIPKQLKENGLTEDQVKIDNGSLEFIIDGYAREAGVRGLEKQLSQICRKVALRIAENKLKTLSVKTKDIEELLGPPIFTETKARTMVPGMSVGLAWTAMGGDTLYIESTTVQRATADGGSLKLTGQMGNVMTESANIAWTYIKNLLKKDSQVTKLLKDNTVHVHIPAGAVPKDGPSAGVTLATSLYGLLTNRTPKKEIAMTGELTLLGEVLPVGGIREKIVAARRSGYKHIILPQQNERDLKEIPASVKKGLKFSLVKNMKDVLKLAFNS